MPGLIKTNVILIAHIIAIAHPFTLLLLLLKLPIQKCFHLRDKGVRSEAFFIFGAILANDFVFPLYTHLNDRVAYCYGFLFPVDDSFVPPYPICRTEKQSV